MGIELGNQLLKAAAEKKIIQGNQDIVDPHGTEAHSMNKRNNSVFDENIMNGVQKTVK